MVIIIITVLSLNYINGRRTEQRSLIIKSCSNYSQGPSVQGDDIFVCCNLKIKIIANSENIAQDANIIFNKALLRNESPRWRKMRLLPRVELVLVRHRCCARLCSINYSLMSGCAIFIFCQNFTAAAGRLTALIRALLTTDLGAGSLVSILSKYFLQISNIFDTFKIHIKPLQYLYRTSSA